MNFITRTRGSVIPWVLIPIIGIALGFVHTQKVQGQPLLGSTDYPNGRKLCRLPNSDDLWITYQNQGNVYAAFSSDGGSTWQGSLLGAGEFPTIALSIDTLTGPIPIIFPVVVWTKLAGVPGRELWCARPGAGGWTVGVLYTDPVGTPNLPSLVIDGDRKAHLTWEAIEPSTRWLRYGTFQADHAVWPPPFSPDSPLDSGPGVGWTMAPCIDWNYHPATSYLMIHVVYKRIDGVYYLKKYQGQWTTPLMISEGGFVSGYPFIHIYGDSVYALWHAYVPPPRPEEVFYRSKHVLSEQWQTRVPVSTTPDWESQFPVMAANYASWSEEFTSPNWEIMMREKPFTGPIYNISNTDATSMYSHINYWQRDTDPEFLYFAWTEGDGSGSPYEVRVLEYPLNHPPVAYLYVGTGQTEPSFYCVERDSFVQFGSEACRQVDIDTDQLIYRLPGLMPWMRYRLVVTAYWEGEGEIRERLDIDGLDQRLIKLEPGVPETLTVSIPPAAYEDDEEANVSLTLISGEWAVSGPMTLYEFEREEGEGGGSQVAGTSDPELRSFNLSQSYPNPFSSASTIEYVVPGPSQTTLKIYDATGRLVRSLVDEEQKRGTYRVSWDGKAENGAPVAGGVYFYRLTAGDFFSSKKVVVLR